MGYKVFSRQRCSPHLQPVAITWPRRTTIARMWSRVLVGIAVVVVSGVLPTASARQTSTWQSLFDGRTLDGWEETPFGGEGMVRVRNGQIVMEFGEPLTGLTRRGPVPRMSYEIRLEAMRLAGSDFFCGLTFPVGETSCSLILGGWGGTTVGLSNIDEQDASGNETTQYIKFEDRRWYAVRVRVTEARITAWLDDRQIIDVETAGKSIGIRPEVDLSRPLGIAAYRTRAAIRGIEIRTLE